MTKNFEKSSTKSRRRIEFQVSPTYCILFSLVREVSNFKRRFLSVNQSVLLIVDPVTKFKVGQPLSVIFCGGKAPRPLGSVVSLFSRWQLCTFLPVRADSETHGGWGGGGGCMNMKSRSASVVNWGTCMEIYWVLTGRIPKNAGSRQWSSQPSRSLKTVQSGGRKDPLASWIAL